MQSLTEIISSLPKRREPVIAIVTGSGETVRAAVGSGVDIILALNAGLYRKMGWGTLCAFMPFGNANSQTQEVLTQHVLPHSAQTPLIAGLFGEDDERVEACLKTWKGLGIQGITNWPAMGALDGRFAQALIEDGYDLKWEARTLARAKKHGFATFGFAYSPAAVSCFVESGVDALILALGLTRSYDDIHEKRDKLQDAIQRVNSMLDAAKNAEHPARVPLTLAYGGPVTMPEDFEQVLRFTAVNGFVGGSAFERIPVDDVVSSLVRRFKGILVERTSESPAQMGLGELVGRSVPMKELFELIRRVAPYDVNVCIEGESGTGKELVATQVHRMSKRAHQSFVTLNCGAIPDTLLESELFGHEKGAFTGATRQRMGKFELAHRGTLFLDEIANLSLHGQVALLRAIQQREIARVGADNYIPVDVRILAASNQPLQKLVEQGKFRADLYHRLNQVTLALPPLRERRSDIALLANDILSRLQVQLNRNLLGLTPGFLNRLTRHGWPGNVRELQHVVLHAALREDGTVLSGKHFSPLEFAHPVQLASRGEDRKAAVREALHEASGNKSRAAAALGVTRKTLYAWMRQEK